MTDRPPVSGEPITANLRAHTGHLLGVLPGGMLVCETCENEVPVLDRHYMGDDCTEDDLEHAEARATPPSLDALEKIPGWMAEEEGGLYYRVDDVLAVTSKEER